MEEGMDLENRPIGIFDSGIGGLTVVKAVREALPNENIIYFGDTARVPYGIKSSETVKEYALQITDFLLRKNVKMIIIACNTVSAFAEEAILRRVGELPVLGVVAAGSQAACTAVVDGQTVGVIGTLGTVGSGTYERAIRECNNTLNVFSRPCPLLVPLAEEGWIDNEVAQATLRIYLHDFIHNHVDALILGCTHYPLFKSEIAKVLDDSKTQIIDSASTVAFATKSLLDEKQLLNKHSQEGTFDCYVSDKPQRFQQLAERFLGHTINRIQIVPLS